jgi:23S rRNA pseudoU1915 N3-methylase RlmH
MTKLDLDSKDKEIQEYVELIQNLKEIKIFKTNNTEMGKELNKDAESYAKSNKLEELMRMRDGDKKISFLYKPGKTDDQISQLFMHINGMEDDNETIVIIINGLIDLKQVSRLANDLNVPGADSLK